MAATDIPSATDLYLVDELLADDERAVRDRLRAFCEAEVLPVINPYWERAEFPFELVPKIADLGLAGGTIEGYGCPGMSAVAAGLVAAGVGAGRRQRRHVLRRALDPAMQSIDLLGSEEQQERWLPGDGPAGDSSAPSPSPSPTTARTPSALETSARRDGDAYVLDGAKRWIGNGPIADLVIVWARDEDGDVGGYVVDPRARRASTPA